MKKPLTYADAGVDINKANALVDQIKEIAKSTFKSNVLSDIGGFGSMYSLNTNTIVTKHGQPILIQITLLK